MAAKNKPNELYITRVYDAPVKMVWDAWTDPKQVAKWWGPRGFTITTHHKDVKPGGTWSYIMHGPDGVDYPNKTLFHEVEKYSRLVYDHGASDNTPPMFRVTVNFSESAGRTTMDMTMTLPTAEAAAETKKFIKKAGGNSTWDRLTEYLADTDKFVITRSIHTQIDKMFQLWTDPKHLSQWLPPTGTTMRFINVDIRPGGSGFYEMSAANGMKMHGKINYLEIVKPHRLVYTQVFCDENQNITRHPMAPTWPETMLTTIQLTAEDANTTRVTVTWEIFGEATATERETFNREKAGMTQGWSGSFDKLDDYINEANHS